MRQYQQHTVTYMNTDSSSKGMRSITIFRLTSDRLYDGGPIRL